MLSFPKLNDYIEKACNAYIKLYNKKSAESLDTTELDVKKKVTKEEFEGYINMISPFLSDGENEQGTNYGKDLVKYENPIFKFAETFQNFIEKKYINLINAK